VFEVAAPVHSGELSSPAISPTGPMQTPDPTRLSVPQPQEPVTPAIPDAPVTPAVPDPGTPGQPEEPARVPTPEEPVTPAVPEPGPEEPNPGKGPAPGESISPAPSFAATLFRGA
jgi:hypothetical protein